VVLTMEVLAGRYRLMDCLGEGGMAVVWRAVDEVLARQVAVKVLGVRYAGTSDSRARVLGEARAAARLTHPHVGAVYDYGESRTDTGELVPFVVMELLAGRSLLQRMRQGPVPSASSVRICAQVASALAAAHAVGLVHRDVKPGNVMLTRDGAKVVDFGLAAVVGDRDRQEPGGFVLGTPEYVAPERLSGGTVVAATDVYALGVMLYRLLSGKFPWKVVTAAQMLDAHVYLEPLPLPPLPGVPPLLAGLVDRCLAKDPTDRPTSAEVATILAQVAGVRVPLEGTEEDEPDAALPGSGQSPDPPIAADPERGARGGVDRGTATVDSVPAAQRLLGVVTADDSLVARLAHRLDPSLDHVELRRQASLLLRGVVGFDLAIWCVLDPVTLMWASCVVDGGPHDERLERELFANEYGQDDVLKLVELADGPRVGLLSASTQGDARASARFRTVLDPRGFTDEVRLAFHDGTTTWGALCLYRAGGHFTDHDLVRLAPASRPLATALRRALLGGESAAYQFPADGAAPPAAGGDRSEIGPGPQPAVPGVARAVPTDGVQRTAGILRRSRRAPRPRTDHERSDQRPAASTTPARAPTPVTGTVTVSPDGRLLAMSEGAGRLLGPGQLSKLLAAVADGGASGLVDATDGLRSDGRWLGFHAARRNQEVSVTVQRIRPHQMGELIARSVGLTWPQWQLLGAVTRGRATHQIARELSMSAYDVQDGLTGLFAAFGVDGRVDLVKALFFDHYLPLHAGDVRVTELAPDGAP
jgi:Protein kinase domain